MASEEVDMKACFIRKPGPAESIEYGELPEPTVGERDVLVRMSAVTVNPIDTYIRSGAFPVEMPLPFIVGRDMAGSVAAIGSGVTRFSVGDRVWCNNQGYAGRQGTFAELLAIEERLLYRLPEGVDPVEAVAVLHSGLTATIGLRKILLQPAETLFVNGGSGNVGTAVLQRAKASGVRVAVTAGSGPKAEWCTELGADLVIDYRNENVRRSLQHFAPDGIDAYWDATPTLDLEQVLAVLKRRGRIVVMAGINHLCPFPVGQFYTRGATLFGFTVTDATVEELAEHAGELNAWLSAGGLKGKRHLLLPLSHAAEAHRMVEQGRPFGKIVLVP